MVVKIALLFQSTRKGEYQEGVHYYSGVNRRNVKNMSYTTDVLKATHFPTTQRAREIIEQLRSNYLKSNCPMFWTDIDVYQEYTEECKENP